jgi:hypothetical protein
VPKIEAPVFVADETAEPPEKELVESMAERFIKLKEEKKKVEADLELTEGILMKFFKATGLEELPIDGRKIVHGFTSRTELDEQYLLSELADRWTIIARPQVKLIQEAIKAGQVDPEIFERAKRVKYFDVIRIKGEKNAL